MWAAVILPFLKDQWLWLLKILGVIAVVLFVFLSIKRAGRIEAEVEQHRVAIRNNKVRKKIENEVRKNSKSDPGSSLRELRDKYSR